jgi:hypothetical protein
MNKLKLFVLVVCAYCSSAMSYVDLNVARQTEEFQQIENSMSEKIKVIHGNGELSDLKERILHFLGLNPNIEYEYLLCGTIAYSFGTVRNSFSPCWSIEDDAFRYF